MEKSRGGGLDEIGGDGIGVGEIGSIEIGGDKIGDGEIGSDAASSAQLKGEDGGAVVQMGLGVGSRCGIVYESASRVPRGVVWTAELVVLRGTSA